MSKGTKMLMAVTAFMLVSATALLAYTNARRRKRSIRLSEKAKEISQDVFSNF